MHNMPNKSDLRATTKLACEIARINSDRFNETVHMEFYKCAPQTVPGKARSFDVDDIVALRLFQRNCHEGLSAKSAGKKACAVREFMFENPDAPRVFLLDVGLGAVDDLRTDFDLTQNEVWINDKQAMLVQGCEMINLDWHRKFVVHAITNADNRRVVGEP